ncbi:MAG TPA: hypothetical protein VIC31_10145 [Rudaea sp.]|jgi:hypothetical protein
MIEQETGQVPVFLLAEPPNNLLRSASRAPAVLGILIYIQVNSGSCALAARDLLFARDGSSAVPLADCFGKSSARISWR